MTPAVGKEEKRKLGLLSLSFFVFCGNE